MWSTVSNVAYCLSYSLLEVPALVDVACVSAQLDDSVLEVLKEVVVRHGSVSSHPPVQIMELQERPGAMLVRWAKVGLDRRDQRSVGPRWV